jgi:hypothetical protein
MGGKSVVEKWGFCFGKANSNSGENKGKSMENSKKGVDNSKERVSPGSSISSTYTSHFYHKVGQRAPDRQVVGQAGPKVAEIAALLAQNQQAQGENLMIIYVNLNKEYNI